jgi:hypothetical protein
MLQKPQDGLSFVPFDGWTYLKDHFAWTDTYFTSPEIKGRGLAEDSFNQRYVFGGHEAIVDAERKAFIFYENAFYGAEFVAKNPV